jgi:hypothetical protein
MARFFRFLLPALLLAFSLTGCEEDVVAVLGTDYPFTLYGAFNPEADTQKVRVFPIEQRLEPTSSDPIDATVTSVDKATGETHTWQDSLLQFSDGTYGHLFWAKLRPAYGHSYQVEVKRSDGATSKVSFTVPKMIQPIVGEPIVSTSIVDVPVFLEGEAPRLIQFELEYWVKYDSSLAGTTKIVIPYTEELTRVDGGWKFNIKLRRDFNDIVALLRGRKLYLPRYGVGLIELNVRAMVVDDAWNPPNDEFDPEILVEPGTMTNVENGFGFVGAGYPFHLLYRPSHELLTATGFRII